MGTLHMIMIRTARLRPKVIYGRGIYRLVLETASFALYFRCFFLTVHWVSFLISLLSSLWVRQYLLCNYTPIILVLVAFPPFQYLVSIFF